MKLWLDDLRDPISHGYEGFVWVKTAEEAIKILKTGEVSFASLDHDLNDDHYLGEFGDEQTGYDVLCWMEENGVWPEGGVSVHTMNPSGRIKMEQAVKKFYGRLFNLSL